MATDPHIPLGAACVYRLTCVKTGKAYIGKTVQPLRRRVSGHLRCHQPIGHALRKHGRAAFRAEVLLVGSEAYCFTVERRLIDAQGTLAPGGYNAAEGGEGFTREEARRIAIEHDVGHHPNSRAALLRNSRRNGHHPNSRAALLRNVHHPKTLTAHKLWRDSPEGREAMRRNGHRNGEAKARAAGYPSRRVLEALQEHQDGLTATSLDALLSRDRGKAHRVVNYLRKRGHNIITIRRPGQRCLYRLIEGEPDSVHLHAGAQ